MQRKGDHSVGGTDVSTTIVKMTGRIYLAFSSDMKKSATCFSWVLLDNFVFCYRCFKVKTVPWRLFPFGRAENP